MKGFIKTYLSEKEYGFIKGDDKKDYFFHNSSLKDKNIKDKLCEGLYLEFDQKATPKGYTAINISILDENISFKYEIPENIYTTKDSIIKGWEFIERSNWVVTGSSRNSPDDAKYDMMQKAKKLGANALINIQYFKTTGSEAGTGRGTHYYTIHNFRGQMVNIAKKSTYGRFEIKDFKNINDEASKLKIELLEKTKSSENFKAISWGVIVLIALFLWGSQIKEILIPVIGTVVLFFIGIIFIKSNNYDDWLNKIN
ncbi:cold-shock protein [Aliarcobacter butzleri]|uniref:cold-shock protein n=1 Tax=Aliarcobacter butzleri TaxID=28197 RepID=UPI00125F8DAA|nr:cold shock domain-containing protein [Aliarcobacter butzleri]